MYIATVEDAEDSIRSERRAAAWLAAGGATALAAPAGFVAIVGDDGPPLCPFRLVTGLPCPGCGATRALAAAAQGDLGTVLGLTPVWPLVALVALLLGVTGLTLAGHGGRPASRLLALVRRTYRERPGQLVAVGIVATLVAWAWALANRAAILG